MDGSDLLTGVCSFVAGGVTTAWALLVVAIANRDAGKREAGK